MTSENPARAYLSRARSRLKALAVLRDDGAFSDVVCEAQELVDLVLKAMLRAAAVEPVKDCDLGALLVLVEHRQRFPTDVAAEVERAARVSADLRRERELAFYGDIDFIPTEEYSAEDAVTAYDNAAWTLALGERAVGRRAPS